jgi:hypothetical protein
MIGEKFGDNHPCILTYNASLVEVYSALADKNVEKK